MFEQGELIVYGSTGVCEVEQVGPLERVQGVDPSRLYYTLSPLFGNGTIYAPVDSPVFMRPVITREKAEELIASIPSIEEEISAIRDQRQLTELYQSSFDSHRCEDLLGLLKTIYAKNRRTLDNGKRPGQVDQRFMKKAEELLYGELAAVLEIPLEEVPEYIAREISAQEQPASALIP